MMPLSNIGFVDVLPWGKGVRNVACFSVVISGANSSHSLE